jgi:hypothetical protein
MRSVAAIAVVALTYARSASALPEPRPPEMVPHVPATVPANVPALITVRQTDGPVIGVASLLQLKVDGRSKFDEWVDPFVDRPDPPVYLLNPTGGQLAPGPHVLTYVQEANRHAAHVVKFSVIAPAPLPTRLGTVTATRKTIGPCPPGKSGGRDLATLDVTMAPEMAPFLGAVMLTLSSEGRVIERTDYGQSDAKVSFGVAAACGGADPGCMDNVLAPGTHTFSIAAHVAGATSDPPPVSTTIELCPPVHEAPPRARGCSFTEGRAGAFALALLALPFIGRRYRSRRSA